MEAKWLLFMFIVLIPIIALLPCVYAHGYVTQVTLGNTTYSAPPLSLYTPSPLTHPSIIRQVRDGTPIRGTSNPSIACGISAELAQGIARNVMPGEVIEVQWMGLDGTSAWPHDIGPIMSYLAACGNINCTELEGTNAKFFLIAREGQTNSQKNGWVQGTLMSKIPVTVTLPSNLAPGGYILRSEIIALHLATDVGGAEFYASCIQLQVGGTQVGKPSANDLVSFPGAYKDDDPGIYTPKIYDEGFVYTFPGPSIARLQSSSSATQSVQVGPQCSLKKRSMKRSTWLRWK